MTKYQQSLINRNDLHDIFDLLSPLDLVSFSLFLHLGDFRFDLGEFAKNVYTAKRRSGCLTTAKTIRVFYIRSSRWRMTDWLAWRCTAPRERHRERGRMRRNGNRRFAELPGKSEGKFTWFLDQDLQRWSRNRIADRYRTDAVLFRGS